MKKSRLAYPVRIAVMLVCVLLCFAASFTAFASEIPFEEKLGTVEPITSGISLVDGVYTNTEEIVLDYTYDSSICEGINTPDWRVMLKLTLSERVTDGEIAQAKYYYKNGETWDELELVSASDYYNAEDKTFIIVIPVSPADYAEEDFVVELAFDWDLDGVEQTVQTVKVDIDMSKVKLIHGENNSNCIKDIKENAVEPDCTNVGYTEISVCSVCGLVLSEKTEVPALGHDFTEKIVNDSHLSEKNGDGTSSYYYNCSREGCDAISDDDTYLVNESDYDTYYADVAAITQGLDVTSDLMLNYTVRNTEKLTLDFAPEDLSIGRYADGWWVGTKIIADSDIPVEELKNVKYRSHGKNGWSQAKSFWANKDSADDADVHYITVWLLVTPDIIANDDNGILELKYEFDWDNNGFGITAQEINIEIDVSDDNIIFTHSAGHTPVIDLEAIEPDCLNGGRTEQSHCSVCGLVINKSEPVLALGHEYTEWIKDEYHLKEAANCVHYDLYRYSCIRCDAMSDTELYEDREGSFLVAHDPTQKASDKYIFTPADCENPAWYYMGCSNCDTVLKDEEKYTTGKPLNHLWTIEQLTTKATVNADGAINFVCADCKKVDDSPIPIPKIDSVKLSATSVYYTGVAVKPSVSVFDRKGAQLTEGKDYTLEYFNTDVPGVATVRVTFCGKYEGYYDAKYLIDIPVTAKAAFVSNNNAIKIAWEKVPYATGYAIYVKNTSGWRLLGTTTAVSALYSKLPSGTKYTFAIRALVIKNGKVYLSSAFKTLDTVTTSPATTKVLSAQTANAIKIAWTAVKGADGYAVYYYGPKGWVLLRVTTGTSALFTNLVAGTNYTFAVRSFNLTASGLRVLGPTFTQYTTATKPVKPVVSVATSGGTATIKWTAVKGASGYNVYYRSTTSGGYVLLDTVSAGTTSFVDSGYTTGSNYLFAVVATKAIQGGYIYSDIGQVLVTMK